MPKLELQPVGAQIDFTVKDQTGATITSASFINDKQKYVLLFYPKASSPGCTQEMKSVSDIKTQLNDNGYKVFGVSTSSAADQQAFCLKSKLKVDGFLCDVDGDVSKKFGCYGEKSAFGKTSVGITRTTFVIDEEGKISHVISKIDPKTHGKQLLSLLLPDVLEAMTPATRRSRRGQDKAEQMKDESEEEEEEEEEEEKPAPKKRATRASKKAAAPVEEGEKKEEEEEKKEEAAAEQQQEEKKQEEEAAPAEKAPVEDVPTPAPVVVEQPLVEQPAPVVEAQEEEAPAAPTEQPAPVVSQQEQEQEAVAEVPAVEQPVVQQEQQQYQQQEQFQPQQQDDMAAQQ